MSNVKEAADALSFALAAVPGVRVYTDLGAPVDPPGIVLGPPALTWEGPCSEPTTARFIAYVVVAADDRALPALWDLAPAVAEAVDAVPDAVVLRADPANFSSGGHDMPAYMIEIEVSI